VTFDFQKKFQGPLGTPGQSGPVGSSGKPGNQGTTCISDIGIKTDFINLIVTVKFLDPFLEQHYLRIQQTNRFLETYFQMLNYHYF